MYRSEIYNAAPLEIGTLWVTLGVCYIFDL